MEVPAAAIAHTAWQVKRLMVTRAPLTELILTSVQLASLAY